jgi:hypothetical protein
MPGRKNDNPETKTQAVSPTAAHAKFLNALGGASQTPMGPINTAAVKKDWGIVTDRAASLLSYEKYLSSARAWKASKSAISNTFESQVRLQAGNALSDIHDLAAAGLRIASQTNNANGFDHALNNWIAGLKASGPMQIEDLWNGLANDNNTRQILKGYGVTDDLFAALNKSMTKLSGTVSERGGNLAVQGKLAGQEQTQNAVIAPTTSGAPTDLSGLLRQGQFDRLVQQFNQEGAVSIALAPGKPRNLSIPEITLMGSVLTVRGVAQHYRTLQDTGLATSAGGGALGIFLAIGFVLAVLGDVFIALGCKEAGSQHPSTTECAIGVALSILGTIILVIGGAYWAGVLVKAGQLSGAFFVMVLDVSAVSLLWDKGLGGLK